MLAPLGLLGALFLGVACGDKSDDDSSETPGPDPQMAAICNKINVDRFKELIVVEPSVVEDARARNDVDGPWSFRHLVEEMAPPDVSASDFVLAWLQTLAQPTTVNLFDVTGRGRTNEMLTCPWLRATPENGCDNACAVCTNRTLDLAKAPFRLIALTNRTDLSENDEHVRSAGESRLVYALTQGPGDDPASEPLSTTVIFEYQNPTDQGRDVNYWVERWHALGSYPNFDADYMAELESLYAEITTRPADRPSWINQVRINDVVLDWLWELREYKLVDGNLHHAPALRTPDLSLNGSQELARFVLDNKADVLAHRHTLPSTLNGGFARLMGVPWRLPGVDEETRVAFARETCDGCHQSERRAVDQGFHISPRRRGLERLSPFVHDPADTSKDELARRVTLARATLCAKSSKLGGLARPARYGRGRGSARGRLGGGCRRGSARGRLGGGCRRGSARGCRGERAREPPDQAGPARASRSRRRARPARVCCCVDAAGPQRRGRVGRSRAPRARGPAARGVEGARLNGAAARGVEGARLNGATTRGVEGATSACASDPRAGPVPAPTPQPTSPPGPSGGGRGRPAAGRFAATQLQLSVPMNSFVSASM
jgi:hypothetical protein